MQIVLVADNYLCDLVKLSRYFIEIAFDGTDFHGWQIQQNAITVQQVLNEALTIALRQPVETTGCGRTDTGVHAKQLFAHFDFPTALPLQFTGDKLVKTLNSLLPYSIAVRRVISVDRERHARFDAQERSYQYHIHFNKDPFKVEYSWLLRDKPNMELMNKAAMMLAEFKDFSCFSKSNTQTFTNNCHIIKAEWQEVDGGMVFHISADRFLRNMVRAIVGTLIQVGRREIKPEEIRNIIESKNRCNAGASVPACGLYLTEVKYPYEL